MMPKKVVILGASGFLGSYLTDVLSMEDRYQVIPLNRQTINLNNYSEVWNFLSTVEPHTIINCATSTARANVTDLCYDDIQNNIGIFMNFYNSSHWFHKFINVGSGAEFDIRTDISYKHESEILVSYPKDSYGYSKNIISRMTLNLNKFYTLRLFGCFDKREHEHRLLKRVLRNEAMHVIDRQFDYISASDFSKIVIHYLDNVELPKDLNCVYPEKLYLSEILDKFNEPYRIVGRSSLNYTGSGSKLASLTIALDGLDKGLSDYK